MITRIKVRNFKSLENFEINNLSMFSCFIGLNGAGKTSVFQFFDFVRAILSGRVKEWFESYVREKKLSISGTEFIIKSLLN